MKILLAHPGKLRTVPMAGFARDALLELGHEVVEFDLSSLWHEKLRGSIEGRHGMHVHLNRRFLRAVDRDRPDVMLAIFGFDLLPETLEALRLRGIPRVCWWLNDPFQFSRSLDKAANYDFLFSNSLGSVEDYRRAGIAHAHWLPTACSPSVHRPVEAVTEFRCEVCFAGDWSPLREHWCEKLSEHFDVRIFGPWKNKVNRKSPLFGKIHDGFFTPDEMARFFASAEVVFNLHSWYGKWDHGTNPRLFEAAGCGACQIVDHKGEIPLLFDIENDLMTFSGQTDLIEKSRLLLNDKKLREHLAENARAKAHSDHTYSLRMSYVLKAL